VGRIVAGVLAAAIVLAPVYAHSVPSKLNPLSHCGTERWHIKTLDDADASKIKATPKMATLDQLRALAVPAGYDKNNDSSRYVPVEETEYTIQAVLAGFKEEADRDLHVVLADPSNKAHTMIGEVPDPQCSTVAASGHAAQISKVRTSFLKCFGPAPVGKLKTFSGAMLVQLTGVGFFDVLHGQTGVGPNGIELHPIVKIKTISGSCPTGYSVP
jgi:hypothetical protein